MKRREKVGWRVGLLVVAALVVAGLAIVIIGGQNHLFRRMNHYTTLFENVQGLVKGSPVQLNGVAVGRVEEIHLADNPGEALRVELTVDRRYETHIRKDSRARIKTIGLLGDKFIEISAGKAVEPALENGAQIESVQAADVDQLLDSGESLVDNISRSTAALAKILERVERGEGLLGQLMAPVPETDKDLSLVKSMRQLSNSLQRITAALDAGKSPVSRLLMDEKMGAELGDTIERLDRVMVAATEGNGVLPKLLSDQEMAARIERSLANLEKSTTDLAAVTASLRSDDGLLPKLLNDKAYADEVTGEIDSLLKRLDNIIGSVERGDGTVGKLIQDPSVYEAINDIVVGINESKMLSWLIRNRQKAGIEKRYEDAQAEAGAEPPEKPEGGENPDPRP